MLKNQTLALNSSAQSQFGKKEIPENLIKKYEEFEKNGGSNKLKAIHKFLIEKCLESGEIVKRIKGKLNGEKQEYEKYKAQYGNRWNSLPSEVVNFDYLKILDGIFIKINFKIKFIFF